LILIGIPILYALPIWLRYDEQTEFRATAKAHKRAEASAGTKAVDELEPGERAVTAVARVRVLIDSGDVAGALAAYDKAARTLVQWPPQVDLFALIKALHARAAEADSLRLMRDHCLRFPAESNRVRLKLAQVLIRECQRPATALEVLSEFPAGTLPADIETARQRLNRQAARIREEGMVELEGDD